MLGLRFSLFAREVATILYTVARTPRSRQLLTPALVKYVTEALYSPKVAGSARAHKH